MNDARDWSALLVDQFGFRSDDIELVTDAAATKTAVLDGVRRLLDGATAGDVLVFTNSSHGSYVADRDGDEDDALYDETMCPYDVDRNQILDDELRTLFATLADGVRLTVISDSCHSGSVTRRPGEERRPRMLPPSQLGLDGLSGLSLAARARRRSYPEEQMREVLVSGCRDREVSYDALIDGDYHGAMSYHAIATIRAAGPGLTYRELGARLTPRLEEAGFPQHPQVEGMSQNLDRALFT
ncbi:MAG: hypothetical protein AVDCRST_MAG79-555 [uncultured Thermoleophilia bacterium]|uniref:Caspase family protein n=1 Tax=uncultured Thermoleophilia bacterium TaxID=1497501 RepID=A0A6J4TLF6_9ACTN|nr:MAG: hypothetical protein AVDCRST_MAG79-555 [uncultured Thermoleophilia bacterium]